MQTYLEDAICELVINDELQEGEILTVHAAEETNSGSRMTFPKNNNKYMLKCRTMFSSGTFLFLHQWLSKAEQKIISYNKSNKYHAKRKHWGNDREHIPRHQKFLYSDHEIFIREIVSNAVDATQKLKTLANKGDFKGETGELKVCVKVDKDNGTITVSDRGLGMTEEEIDKYINQIAFSGANDFLDKYKDDANAIIGHFGLGFYSSFMVSKKVEIVTKSYQEGAKAVKWSCDGSPSYEIEETEKADRGTDIIMYIDDDCKEFLEKNKIEELLRKYCRFLPVPVAFGKKTEWKDGKQVDTEEDNVINNVTRYGPRNRRI